MENRSQTTGKRSWSSAVLDSVDRKTLVKGAAVTGAAAAVLAAPAALSAVGFGSPGVTAGSTAAGMMSTMGTIPKGSLYSLCQSWGAAGLPAAAQAVTAATGAGLGSATVIALDAAWSAAAKAGKSLATAGASTANLASAVQPIAVKTGTWMSNVGCSAASAVWNNVDRQKLIAGAAVTGAAAAVLAAPAALSAVGFASPGVIAGSKAAAMMSTMGGVIAKGSLFSLCQSWGAAGLPAAAQAVAAATGAGLGGATVIAMDAAWSTAVKAGRSITAAGASAANLASEVQPVAVKAGTLVANAGCSAASAIKAGTRLCTGGFGAGTEPEKPLVSRL